jgi:hypothetical protein
MLLMMKNVYLLYDLFDSTLELVDLTNTRNKNRSYTLLLPPEFPELDLNVMKLSAQFVAKNGMTFQTGLLEREHRNPMVLSLIVVIAVVEKKKYKSLMSCCDSLHF